MKTIIFIGGVPRSGTTFLAYALADKINCAVVPESHFKYDLEVVGKLCPPYLWEAEIYQNLISETLFDDVTGIESFYDKLFSELNVSVIIDHTPDNFRYAEMLKSIRGYNIKFISIIRHPLDVVSSVIPLDWGPNDVVGASRWYLECLSYNLPAMVGRRKETSATVSFEALVNDYDRVIFETLDCLGLSGKSKNDPESVLVLPSYTQSQHTKIGSLPDKSVIGSYKKKLSGLDIERASYFLKSVSANLGYDINSSLATTSEVRPSILSTAVALLRVIKNKIFKIRRQFKRS